MVVSKLFLIYMVYSLLGWFVEVIDLYIVEHKFVNRGFLIGPYCPIYGKSVLIISFLLHRYINKPILLFIMSMLICSIIEYLGSFILEKVFKTRWWDYSHKKFNINGRICLENMFLFGIGSVIVMYFINPLVLKMINSLSSKILFILSLIIFIIYFIDNAVSLIIILNFRQEFNKADGDCTENVAEFVKKELNKRHKLFHQRLINSFPKIKIINRKSKNNEKNN